MFWRERSRNKERRLRVGVAKRISRKVLNWFGHVERTKKERLNKRVYDSEVEGRKDRCRIFTRWDDTVKKAYSAR